MKLRPVALSIALLAAAIPARAQPAEEEPAPGASRTLAEALFQAGKQLMVDGKTDEACAKLAESQRLEPGGGTVLLLGICHETQGRWATAAAELRSALSLAKRDRRVDREKLAQKHLADVEPKVSYVVFVLPPDAPRDLMLVVDGTPVSREALDVPLPMDPGAHAIRAEASRRIPYAATVTVGAEHEEQRIVIPALEPVPAPPPAPRERPQPAPFGTPRTLALVAGGAGIAALGAGTFFGVRAIDQSDDARAMCDPDRCTSREAIARNDEARTSATLANVTVGVGLALVAAGVVLWLTAPRGQTAPHAAQALRVHF